MKRWYYSLAMLVAYLALFLFWKQFPSRASFIAGGFVTAGALIAGMVWASRRDYFVNRLDRRLHALVILDVVLEALVYEVLRLTPMQTSVEQLHNNNNFYGCAAAFAAILGLYRWRAMRKQSQRLTEPAHTRAETTQESPAEQPAEPAVH